MSLQLAVMQFLNGLSSGMVIFLVAAGLSLIFGTLRVLNLAHASFYMLGAYFSYWLGQVVFVNLTMNFWLALLVGPMCVAIIGGLIEVFIIRRIYDQDFMLQFILTFGLSLIIADMVKFLWGIQVLSVPIPEPFTGSIPILGAYLLKFHVFLYIAGIGIFLGLLFLINRTKLGKLIRMVTYNREIASSLGVNVPSVYTGVFMLGSWLAGFGGAASAPLTSITLGMDHLVLIQCFIVVVIGGMGSISGAFLGSIILGLLNAFGILWLPQMALVFGFLLMAIILIIRPYGLMGEPMKAEEKF